MAETSYPWPDPDNSNKRVITDAEYERLTHPAGLDGVVGTPSDTAVIYADSSGMHVKVRAGKLAHLRGFAWESGDADFTKAIGANSSGATRLDLIVLRLARATWAVTVEVRAGTPGAGLPPATQDADVYEIPLAAVTVIHGATTVAAADVTTKAWYVGESGIVCTSTTRPPVAENLTITETDTGAAYIGINGTWVVLHDDTGWMPLSGAVGSGWTVDSLCEARWRRHKGKVTVIVGVARTGGSLAAGTNTTLITLPTAIAPPFTVRLGAVIWTSGYPSALVGISTAGVVGTANYGATIPTGARLYLPPITYPL